MNIRARVLALLLVVAMLLGAGAAYVGIQLAKPEPNNQAKVEKSENNGTINSDSTDQLNQQQKELIDQLKATNGDLQKVVQAYTIIKENALKERDNQTLVEGAVKGMLDTLDDPFSVYMDKETMDQFSHSIESTFEGIGAEVSMKDGKVTIVSPFKDSPAEKAGLKPNDQILSVDGNSIEGLDLYEAVLKIRGEKGTTVTLEVDRPGITDNLKIDVVRDEIPIETVYSKTKDFNGKKVGVIEITSFSEQTADHFNKQLKDLEDKGIDGLVIDVRGNPGGLFTQVEAILKNFITKDHPYVQIEDRNGEKSRYFSELENAKSYPIDVLIDEGSASASEILAGAMSEAGGYKLVGTKSYGKGTVQQTISMGDGSTIKLTLFKWLTPDGNWIHKKGIEPTVEVKQPDYFYANPIQLEEPLKYDMNSEKVENVQVILKGLGYNPGRTDGYFSKDTEAALKKFQGHQNLDVTGVVDETTAQKLEQAIIEKVQDKKNDLQMNKALEELFK